MYQCCFYVLSKEKIKELSRDRGNISLARIEKFNHEPVSFNDLARTISYES
jgi:hypothetical protein